MRLKESYFTECWNFSYVVPVFNNLRERSVAKRLISVVSKIFEKLVNNGLVDHLKKIDLFYS